MAVGSGLVGVAYPPEVQPIRVDLLARVSQFLSV